MRMVERTIASGICLASDGHGCESVLISATKPRANAHAVKITIAPIINVRTIAPTRLLCSGDELRAARQSARARERSA